jgi:hypothetical protein
MRGLPINFEDFFYMENKRTAIVFVDGNNWYHNVKSITEKPGNIDFNKLANFICDTFDLILKEPIRYYNSTPDITDGEVMYYKHMEYLSSLEKQGIRVITRKLQKSSTEEILREKETKIIKVLKIVYRKNIYKK